MRSQADALSDNEIMNRFAKKRQLRPTDHPEAFTLDIISQHTTIPVPRVRKVIHLPHYDHSHLLVMDLIPGKQLSTLWPTMSNNQRAVVAETLRGYIQQLRQIKIDHGRIPGPLDREMIPKTCESPPVFGPVVSQRGPFPSYAHLAAFWDSRRDCVEKFKGVHVTSFDTSYPLVLTHQDLNPRNIVVGNDGKLWIVDWAWAGFYPEWWESVAMKEQAENEKIVWGKDDIFPSWDEIIPLVCGEYKQMENWLDEVAPCLSWGYNMGPQLEV
ncbi:hypothetical protein K438DRAFT_2151849 [Mycena galopus ATCC 62051]|nr:hypothetical protein K438DRAFT_2151849 [Mycena galopus ATCC 62051]